MCVFYSEKQLNYVLNVSECFACLFWIVVGFTTVKENWVNLCFFGILVLLLDATSLSCLLCLPCIFV